MYFIKFNPLSGFSLTFTNLTIRSIFVSGYQSFHRHRARHRLDYQINDGRRCRVRRRTYNTEPVELLSHVPL